MSHCQGHGPLRAHRRATVAQIDEKLNTGHDRKVSEHTAHKSLLRMGLHSQKTAMMTPVHHRKCLQSAHECENWTMEEWKKVAWLNHILDQVDGPHTVHNFPG